MINKRDILQGHIFQPRRLSYEEVAMLLEKPNLDLEEVPFFLCGYKRMLFHTLPISPLPVCKKCDAIKDLINVYSFLLDSASWGGLRDKDGEHIFTRTSDPKALTKEHPRELKKRMVAEFFAEEKTHDIRCKVSVLDILHFSIEYGIVLNEHLQKILGISQTPLSRSSYRAKVLSSSELGRLFWLAEGQAWMFLRPSRKNKGEIVAEIANDQFHFSPIEKTAAFISRKKHISEALAKIDPYSRKIGCNDPIPIPGIVSKGRVDLCKFLSIYWVFCTVFFKEGLGLRELRRSALSRCYLGETPHPLVESILSDWIFSVIRNADHGNQIKNTTQD